MPDPWDPLPYPAHGDHDEDSLYAAVGRTIDAWERVEFELSWFYSLFLGDHELGKMQEYGGAGGNIFRDRAVKVAEAANAYFISEPDQEREAVFNRLLTAAKGFSDRRNEVAHGMLMDVRGFVFWRNKMPEASQSMPQYLWHPPYYHARKHGLDGMPTFGYSSIELGTLNDRFFELEYAMGQFRARLWPQTPPPEPV